MRVDETKKKSGQLREKLAVKKLIPMFNSVIFFSTLFEKYFIKVKFHFYDLNNCLPRECMSARRGTMKKLSKF